MNKPPEIQEVDPESTEIVATPSEEVINSLPSSDLVDTSLIEETEMPFTQNQAPAATYTLENDLMTVTFNSKGGRIAGVELKEFLKIQEDENHEELVSQVQLFEDTKNSFGYVFESGGREINTDDLSFAASTAANEIVFTTGDNQGGLVKHTYTLSPGSYAVDHKVEIANLPINTERGIDLVIENYLDKIEKNDFFERTYSTVYYKELNDDSDYCSCRGDDLDDRSDRQMEWVSFSNQFFNTAVISKDRPFAGLIASTNKVDDDAEDLKLTTAAIHMPDQAGSVHQHEMTLYFGPNDYSILRSFDNGIVEIIPFGRSIFGDINRAFIRPFFNWLSQFIANKGLVIIVLIFIIKMALYPLTYKMLHSQAKMGALKPQLAKMKEKFKDDAQKQQMETMKVYREYGVSPFGGCMPMVLQIPIWYALFRFFPASITFRQESFLWADDLSSYDVLFYLPFHIPTFGSHVSLFTILWAISTVLYTFYNMRHMDMSANPAMKYVQYLMPLMFFAFFNNYASGLTCYMFFSQMITVSQTILTKKFVFDDEKIMAELNIQKAKPKKKSSFQSRLEEAMKQQQRLQEQKKKDQAKKKKK